MNYNNSDSRVNIAIRRARDRADIPNSDGFNLEVLLRNGVWKATSVVWSHGAQMHHLNGVNIADVVDWRPLAP